MSTGPILLAGATGLIGRHVARELAAKGHPVRALVRDPAAPAAQDLAAQAVACWTWSGLEKVPVAAAQDCGAIINLCGAGIAAGRWTTARRRELRSSRLEPTAHLAVAAAAVGAHLLSASGLGIYGDVPGPCAEHHPVGTGFLAELARDWELAAEPARRAGVPVSSLRLGPVLAAGGGMLREVLAKPLAVLGPGTQALPWIHVADVVGVVQGLLAGTIPPGVVNLAAPGACTFREFVTVLAFVAGRRLWPGRAPAWALRLVLGEMAEMLLAGPAIECAVLARAGYRFRFPGLEPALRDCLR